MMEIEEKIIPVIKGDILKLGAKSVGKNGDIMFDHKGYRLFLKSPKDGSKMKSITLGQQIKLKVVKIYPSVGYVELYNGS